MTISPSIYFFYGNVVFAVFEEKKEPRIFRFMKQKRGVCDDDASARRQHACVGGRERCEARGVGEKTTKKKKLNAVAEVASEESEREEVSETLHSATVAAWLADAVWVPSEEDRQFEQAATISVDDVAASLPILEMPKTEMAECEISQSPKREISQVPSSVGDMLLDLKDKSEWTRWLLSAPGMLEWAALYGCVNPTCLVEFGEWLHPRFDKEAYAQEVLSSFRDGMALLTYRQWRDAIAKSEAQGSSDEEFITPKRQREVIDLTTDVPSPPKKQSRGRHPILLFGKGSSYEIDYGKPTTLTFWKRLLKHAALQLEEKGLADYEADELLALYLQQKK